MAGVSGHAGDGTFGGGAGVDLLLDAIKDLPQPFMGIAAMLINFALPIVGLYPSGLTALPA